MIRRRYLAEVVCKGDSRIFDVVRSQTAAVAVGHVKARYLVIQRFDSVLPWLQHKACLLLYRCALSSLESD